MAGSSPPENRPETIEEYAELHKQISAYSRNKRYHKRYIEMSRSYGEWDLFYLARYILSTSNPHWLVNGKQALDHELPFWFCRELEDDANEADTLFLLSREHLKSTLSTFAKTIQLNIRTPNRTVALVSDTLGLSRSFLRQIGVEYETNPKLPEFWPEVCYELPKKDSKRWSVGIAQPGLLLMRDSNQKEVTVTPVGLDTAPETGPHYDVMRYDDIVTRRNTTSPKLMEKTRNNLKASYSLGKDGGYSTYVGTTYHPLDAYSEMLNDEDRPEIREIRIPCYKKGAQGEQVPTYYSLDYLEKKERDCGKSEFATQWLLDTRLGLLDRMEEEWIRYYNPYQDVGRGPKTLREHLANEGLTWMVVDGAGGEKKYTTDYTVIQIWSTQRDESIVLLDAIRDRLNPSERIRAAMDLYQKWGQYRFQRCHWEAYGMDADIFWLQELQTKESNYFDVVQVAGHREGKKERIEGRCLPAFRERKIVLPDSLPITCKYLGGLEMDYVQHFVGIALAYPHVRNDDDLDCMSRMFEPKHPLVYPRRARKDSLMDPYDQAEKPALRPDAVAPWG